MVLHLPRHRQVTLHALLFTRNALIEPRVFYRNGHLRRQRAHGAQMIFSEISAARVLQIEHADDLVLIDERHAKFRACLRIGFDVARVAIHIRCEHGLFALRGRTHQATANGNIMLELDALLEANRKTVYQLLFAGIQQQDGEHVVIDDLQ